MPKQIFLVVVGLSLLLGRNLPAEHYGMTMLGEQPITDFTAGCLWESYCFEAETVCERYARRSMRHLPACRAQSVTQGCDSCGIDAGHRSNSGIDSPATFLPSVPAHVDSPRSTLAPGSAVEPKVTPKATEKSVPVIGRPPQTGTTKPTTAQEPASRVRPPEPTEPSSPPSDESSEGTNQESDLPTNHLPESMLQENEIPQIPENEAPTNALPTTLKSVHPFSTAATSRPAQPPVPQSSIQPVRATTRMQRNRRGVVQWRHMSRQPQ